ncbi:hypothetical protein SHKM778_80320 [Streptomyces sp. KM77-8]|uniref:Uncharacterized protein n=1 Tax=Streptomyces haneummycinicus TaxID=3074435 RepID=A0AAT9HW91_9ACTN
MTDTPRSPRRRSQASWRSSRAGVTVTRYGSSEQSPTEWYIATQGTGAGRGAEGLPVPGESTVAAMCEPSCDGA